MGAGADGGVRVCSKGFHRLAGLGELDQMTPAFRVFIRRKPHAPHKPGNLDGTIYSSPESVADCALKSCSCEHGFGTITRPFGL